MGSLTIAVLIIAAHTVSGTPYGGDVEEMYNSDYDSYSNDEAVPDDARYPLYPKFVTASMATIVNEGESARLPCEVDRLEGFVLMWKQKEKIVVVEKQIVDQRFRIEAMKNGNVLVLDNVTPEDAGEYTCRLSAYKPAEITHKVTVRVRPVIQTVPSDVLVVREGEPAKLTCSVLAGSPAPAITWTRKHINEKTAGNILSWDSVTRHNAGHYICEADNGFGTEPERSEVKLEVHHVPHVSVEEEYIHTADGEEVKLTCTVHCSPKCQVDWTKDGEMLDVANSQNYYSNVVGSAHSITILRVSMDSLGLYSCKASNPLGINTANIQVSGLAQPAEWQMDSQSPWEDRFFLEWSSVSKTPITAFSLEYRAEREFSWSRLEVGAVPVADDRWQGSVTLEHLAPAARYEARVAARNLYGLSNYSKPFVFATKGAAPLRQHSISGSSKVHNSVVASISVLLVSLFFVQKLILN